MRHGLKKKIPSLLSTSKIISLSAQRAYTVTMDTWYVVCSRWGSSLRVLVVTSEWKKECFCATKANLSPN